MSLSPDQKLAAYFLGRRIAGQRRKQDRVPVAYLYNGVRASAIPEYDKDRHPYVVLCLYDYMSAISKTDKLVVYFLSDIKITNDLYDTNGTYRDFVWHAPGDKTATATRPYDSAGDFTEFGEVSELSDSLKFALENVIWTNTDLYNTDGTLYLASSDPVPVYE